MIAKTLINHTGKLITIVRDHKRDITIHPSSLSAPTKTSVTRLRGVNIKTPHSETSWIGICQNRWKRAPEHYTRGKYIAHILRECDALVLALHGRVDDIYYVQDDALRDGAYVVRHLWQVGKP